MWQLTNCVTPIQPILGLADVLKSEIKDKGQLELLDVILKNVKRFQRLSQDILDVTMIESRSLKLNKYSVDLNYLIQDIVKDLQNQIKTSDSKVKLVFEPETEKGKQNPIIVEADKERITQVLWNLFNNAIKFTKEGTISISTKIKDGQVIVSVKDTGEGIDPKIRPRLFSKFVTGSSQGDRVRIVYFQKRSRSSWWQDVG